MRGWSTAQDIDASVLRDLLRGVGVSDPDPRGVHLRGARIRGRLDLDRLTTTSALFLEDCLLDEGITADAARLPALRLYRCRIAHPNEPAMRADALRVSQVAWVPTRHLARLRLHRVGRREALHRGLL